MICKTNKLKIGVFALVSILALAVIPLMAEESDADSQITLTDGRGQTFTLSDPATHIATLGKGVTLTAIELGFTDNIVVCDKSSKDSTNSKFAGLIANIDSGKTVAGGSIYSDYTQYLTNLYDAADKDQRNVFDMENDAVFITVGGKDTSNSGKNAASIESSLKEKGFKNVLIWYEITEYSEIVSLVEQVSLALTGKTGSVAEQMAYTTEYIADKLEGVEKTNAFYVTYSSNDFKVGNYGSLATSLLIAAGANVVTLNKSIEATTYLTNLPILVENYDHKVVVFADNTVTTNDKISELKNKVGDKVTIVPMDALWNNFCPDSMEGVWTMACALYPDLFEGDVPEVTEDDDDNFLIYAGAAVVAVIIIGLVAFMFMRGKH